MDASQAPMQHSAGESCLSTASDLGPTPLPAGSMDLACPPERVQAALPEGAQTHFRSIVTNDFLQVKGSGGSIFAIGDAATIEQVQMCRCCCGATFVFGFSLCHGLHGSGKRSDAMYAGHAPAQSCEACMAISSSRTTTGQHRRKQQCCSLPHECLWPPRPQAVPIKSTSCAGSGAAARLRAVVGG